MPFFNRFFVFFLLLWFLCSHWAFSRPTWAQLSLCDKGLGIGILWLPSWKDWLVQPFSCECCLSILPSIRGSLCLLFLKVYPWPLHTSFSWILSEIFKLQVGYVSGSVAGKRMGWEKMVMSQVSGESLGWLSNVGSWLHIEKNSSASHREVKERLFRETRLHRLNMDHLRRQEKHQGTGRSVFIHAVCLLSLQSCSILCDPVDYRPPGSSVHRVLQARILE